MSHKFKRSNPKYIQYWHYKHPWYKRWELIYSRCHDSKHPSYQWYGKKGIKCLISRDDLKYLWFRDKAYKLKSPTVDRINSRQHYMLKNCRFIERSLNSKLSHKGRTFKSYPCVKIRQLTLKGKQIKVFNSIVSASKALGIRNTTIFKVLNNLQGRTQTRGFRFKYVHKVKG
jgi:hypothetical protein